jgi:signal peptidase
MLMPSMFGGRVAYVVVTGHSMDPTFANGDLVAVRKQSHYHIGDVIAYRIPNGQFGSGRTVIHRIVGGNAQTGFLTRGDNRTTDDMWHPTPADIKGTRWFRIPGIGTTVDYVRSPLGIAAFAALLSILAVLALIPKPSNMARDEGVTRTSSKLNPDEAPHVLRQSRATNAETREQTHTSLTSDRAAT